MSFQSDWMPIEDNNFYCPKCGSNNMQYREWESSCGGYDDIAYRCEDCRYTLWSEGPDA